MTYNLRFIADKAFTVSDAPDAKQAYAVPNYLLEEPERERDFAFVKLETALAGLALPSHDKENKKLLWPADLYDYVVEEYRHDSSIEVLEGKSKYGMRFGTLAVADNAGKAAYLQVFQDAEAKKMLVVGPEPVSPALAQTLKQNGVDYALTGDRATEDKINSFFADSAKSRIDLGRIVGAESLTVEFVKAMSSVYDDPENPGAKDLVAPSGIPAGRFFKQRVSSPPVVYTSIVTPKA